VDLAGCGVLVTGAASGIGRASALAFASAGARVGVHGLTRAAALELAPYGIRVNAVAPGVTRTRMTSGVSAELLADVPLRRIAEPEEVADAVRWLATASYATGTVLTVDGGYTAR
jgi:NAD(P)-dependent dehydrogenase (short-subunit alcohol dehydrogenase family)